MIRVTDNHGPRLGRMAFGLVAPAVADEVEAGTQAIVDEAVFSIKDGAISGPGHIRSLPGEPPNADTHVLDQSGHIGDVVETPDTIRGSAIFDAPYARYLEHGTSRMEPRPFLSPASNRLHSTIIRSLAERLRKERG